MYVKAIDTANNSKRYVSEYDLDYVLFADFFFRFLHPAFISSFAQMCCSCCFISMMIRFIRSKNNAHIDGKVFFCAFADLEYVL